MFLDVSEGFCQKAPRAGAESPATVKEMCGPLILKLQWTELTVCTFPAGFQYSVIEDDVGFLRPVPDLGQNLTL